MSTIQQAKTMVEDQYSPTQAAEGFAFAEAQGYSTPEEFLSLAMSKVLYSAIDLDSGARYSVEQGSIEEYFA